MTASIIQALVRHILTAVGGGLILKYGADASAVETMVGGASAAVGVAWSVYEKRQALKSAA